MKHREPRPCPYCLQRLTASHFERHVARCRERDVGASMVTCLTCGWPICRKLITRHLRTCWLRNTTRIGDVQRQKLCDQIERIERAIARRERRRYKGNAK